MTKERFGMNPLRGKEKDEGNLEDPIKITSVILVSMRKVVIYIYVCVCVWLFKNLLSYEGKRGLLGKMEVIFSWGKKKHWKGVF